MRPAARSWSSTTSRRSARSCAATCSGRATRRTWHSTVSRRWRWRPRAGPTSWCSTSCCRASTAWRRCAASALSVAGALAIILLTARGEESDRIIGLRLGADDYIVKPFSPAELVARVDAVLRRIDTVGAEQQPPLRFDGLVVDPAGRRVLLDEEQVVLTQREFELLLFLARHPGQAFTRNQLMDHVWRLLVLHRHLDGHRPHPPPAGQARGDPGAPALDRDGVGRRLPLRGVRRLACSLGFAIAAAGRGGDGGARRLRRTMQRSPR